MQISFKNNFNFIKKMGCLFFKSGYDKISSDLIPQNIWDIQIENLKGEKEKFGDYKNNTKAFLIVNVASCWGMTSTNYSQLVDLNEKYASQGLMIMGFPSTQFMNQEKNTNEEIIEFLKENNVKFPVFSKTIVNGSQTHPLFIYLKTKSSLNESNKGLKNIPWNFGKFLMDEEGNNVKFYTSTVKPKEIEDDIMKMIKV